MSNSNYFFEKIVLEEKKQIKAFQNKLVSNWFWFLIFGGIGLFFAYMVSYYSPSKYEAKSTILVQNEYNALHGKEFFQNENNPLKKSIQDHIGVLKSRVLTSRVIHNLNWTTSWYHKMIFYDLDLYGREPFIFIEPDDNLNPRDIPIYITMITDEQYIVRTEIDGISNILEEIGEFGTPFKNAMFDFTLEKQTDLIVPVGIEYFLVFNDLEALSLELSSLLEVSLDDLKGNLIAIKLRGNQADRVVDFVNELSKEYIEYSLGEKNRISNNTIQFIDLQLEGVTDSLNKTGHLFRDFQAKNKSMNLKQESELIKAALKRLEEEYSVAERKLNYYRSLNRYLINNSQLEKVENKLRDVFGGEYETKNLIVPSIVDITDPVLNNLVLRLRELSGKREVLSYSVKENEPNMLVLEKEITHIKQSLQENLANLLVNAERDLRSIANRLSNQQRIIAGLPKIEQKFINIKRRYDLNNDLYNFLLKKRAEAEVTIASNIPNSQILDRASLLSVVKVGPKTIFNMIAGFFIGIAIPFFFLKTSHYFNNSIDSIQELEMGTELPVLGIIAHNKHPKELLVSNRPRAQITESFRSLRTDLENLLADKSQKIISVQSIIPGEGKSFVSINLAAILAMNHKNVLLIEGDMRKPKLSKIFGVNGKSGMSCFLEDKENLYEIIHPTHIDNLSFIPAGPVPINPAELLANGRFNRFLQSIKIRYNYVIIDNAPVSVVTDGLLSGKHADINLFVLRHRFSRKDQVNYINKLVEKGSVKNAALLLNDFKFASFNLGRGYYHDDFSPKELTT